MNPVNQFIEIALFPEGAFRGIIRKLGIRGGVFF